MKTTLSLVLVLSGLSVMGFAQNTNLDAEVEAELNKMYQSTSDAGSSTVTIPAEPAPTAPAAVQPSAVPPVAQPQPVTNQPIYIVNPPQAAQPAQAPVEAVQKQPTTLIEASPLTDSRAEGLRKARQDAELSTEAKIVEKLEQSRLEDERRRAQILFGDKLNGGETQSQPAPSPAPVAVPVAPQIIIIPAAPAQPVAPVAPAVPVAPVAPPVVETPKTEASLEEKKIEAEMEAALKAETSVAVPEVIPVVPVAEKYFSGLVGVSDTNSNLVKGNYLLGFTFGTKYD
ncbi:MAG: hypothetical protein ACK5V3_02210, partial [Bdellovibrionales bacterium]